MSYISKKERLFQKADPEKDCAELLRKRSEGRMKTYHSCTDRRAWSMDEEERRRHLLELIERGTKGCTEFVGNLGQYIPVPVLIDTLMSQKNAEIDALSEKLMEMERMLTPEQRQELEEKYGVSKTPSKRKSDSALMKDKGKAKGKKPPFEEGSIPDKKKKRKDDDDDGTADKKKKRKDDDGKIPLKTGDKGSKGSPRMSEKDKDSPRSSVAFKDSEGSSRIEGKSVDGDKGSKRSAESEMKKIGSPSKASKEGGSEMDEEELETISMGTVGTKEGEEGDEEAAAGEIDEGKGKKKKPCPCKKGAAGAGSVMSDDSSRTGASATGVSGTGVSGTGVSATGMSDDSSRTTYPPDLYETGLSSDEFDEDETNLKKLLIRKDSKIISLKNLLAAKESALRDKDEALREALRRLESINETLEENEALREQLQDSMTKIKTLEDEREKLQKEKKDAEDTLQKVTSDPVFCGCRVECDLIESKLDEMMVANLAPEDETRILWEELSKLKKYCSKMAEIEEERNILREKVLELERRFAKLKGSEMNEEYYNTKDFQDGEEERFKQQLASMKKIDEKLKQMRDMNCKDDGEESDNQRHLQETVDTLSVKLSESMSEKEALKIELEEIKKKLEEGKTQPELLKEIECLRDKIKSLKQKLAEIEYSGLSEETLLKLSGEDELEEEIVRIKLDRTEGMEDKVVFIKQRAEQADSLEEEVKRLRALLNQLKEDHENCVCHLEGIKKDRNKLQDRLEDVEKQASSLEGNLQRKCFCIDDLIHERDMLLKRCEVLEEELAGCAHEVENLQKERNRLNLRINELNSVDVAYMELLAKTSNYDTIEKEREIFKQKFEELAALLPKYQCMCAEIQKLRNANQENDNLKRKIKELECAVADQEDEMQKLILQIEKLTTGSDPQQVRCELKKVRFTASNRMQYVANKNSSNNCNCDDQRMYWLSKGR